MAINKKLIHFKNKENFDNEVANGNILDNSIVFIQDSKEISTHGTIYKSVNWSILEETVSDLSMFDIYGNTTTQNTANCYVVKETGTYKFPCVYGNSIKNGNINSIAYLNNGGSNSHNFVNYKGVQITNPYISVDTGESIVSAQLSTSDTSDVFTNIAIEEDYVVFTVNSIPDTGANGVISIKNAEGTIMWNWHIWVWKNDLTPVTITNHNNQTYDILPVNLATKLDDSGYYKNWFYQWGRNTPLILPASYNSTDNHTNYGVLDFSIVDNPTGNYEQGIINPNIFYSDSTATYNNWFGSKSYYNLWNLNCFEIGISTIKPVKTIYDPCPVGFQIPNDNVFTGFTTTGINATDSSQYNVIGDFQNGWNFKKNTLDEVGIFFPATGFRKHNNGLIRQTSVYGYVWTSDIESAEFIYHLNFTTDKIYTGGNYPGVMGFSVRPVKE